MITPLLSGMVGNIMFKIIGYYICKIIQIPHYLNRKGTMVSVSNCFGGIHPRLDTCYFQNDYIPQKERDLYKAVWELDEEKSARLIRDIHRLLGKELANDGRFARLSDARYFYDTYLFFKRKQHNRKPVFNRKYYGILQEEMQQSRHMANTFDEVIEFSRQIHGPGEPVEWLPCRIGLCK